MSRSPLYRKALVAVILLALIAAGIALAQEERHRSHQLRAVALVELYGPASKPTGGRLLPVFVLDRDKYYDAATYDATPRPLALDPGNVYEAVDGYSVSAGFFTVAAAKQDKGDWYGLGQWKSAAEVKAAEAAAAARKKAVESRGADTGPPKLKHGGSGSGTEKPAEKTEKKESAAPSGDSDRPQLKRHDEAKPASAATTPPLPAAESDPDRPTLRHSAGEQVKTTTLDYTPPPAPSAKTGLQPRPGGPTQIFIAVSDPDGTGTLHPLNFPWKPEEEKTLKAKAIAIADAELNNYLQARRGAPVKGLKGKKPGPAAHLANPVVFSYDLLLDNNVVQIVSGEANGVFVTVVTRTDLEFEPKKIFAEITDKDHLDAVPRLEFIGPVDADGKGKAELLFKAVSDAGFRYQLYKTGREQVWKLWESGLYQQQ